MRHIDPEILALLALGEAAGDDDDRQHLESCAECAAELVLLRDAATVGRSTIDLQDLETPDERVWSRISAELGLASRTNAESTSAPTESAVSGARVPDDGRDSGQRAGERPPLAPTAESPIRPVVPLRRRLVFGIVGAAAAVAVIIGGIAAWQLTRPTPSVLVAQAALDPFPDWPDATGSASIVRDADGRASIEVDLDTTVGPGSYREVWLISTDGTRLISLGVIDGARTVLPLPDGVDLSVFTIVDVSREDFDGDPGHSGDSIVRGPLSPA